MRQPLRERGSLAIGRTALDFLPLKQAADRESATLFALMANGDESAVVRLYDLHSPLLFGLATAMVRDRSDAEVVVVDTFAQAWNETQRLDCSGGPVVAWLTTMARQRATDRIRARTRIASPVL